MCCGSGAFVRWCFATGIAALAMRSRLRVLCSARDKMLSSAAETILLTHLAVRAATNFCASSCESMTLFPWSSQMGSAPSFGAFCKPMSNKLVTCNVHSSTLLDYPSTESDSWGSFLPNHMATDRPDGLRPYSIRLVAVLQSSMRCLTMARVQSLQADFAAANVPDLWGIRPPINERNSDLSIPRL